MACACTHSLRMIVKYTICLDIFYDLFDKKKNNKQEQMHLPLLEEDKLFGPPVKESHKLVYFCFFVGGVALSLCWNAFAFIVPYWILTYDPSIWKDFVVCYNVPGFPILVLQLFTDDYVSKRIGTRRAYILRISFALLSVAALTAAVPFTQEGGKLNRVGMLFFTTLVGIAVGCGHGWIYSVVSFYPSKAVAYLAAGGGMSTLMLVGLTLFLNYPNNESVAELFKYFEPVFIATMLGTICLLCLFFTDYSAVLLSKIDQENLGIQSVSEDKSPMLKDTEPAAEETPGNLVKYIWSPLVSVFLLLFSIVAAVALIPNIPSEHNNNMNFPAYILYVTSLSAFVGNEVAVYFPGMKNKYNLLIFSSIRFLIFPFLLVYANHLTWRNDLFILSLLGVFGASGAFGVSKCYSLCSASVSVSRQASASNYLNIMLYIGCYFGLAFPYILPYI